MEIVKLRNGVANPRRRKRRNAATTTSNPRRRKRRNPVATATANPRRRRRRRNPVAVSAVANPRRRHHKRRRNPTIAVANKRHRRHRRNGIFGDTKSDAKNVLALAGGLVGTKIVGGMVSPYGASLLSSVGLGRFAQPIVDGALAVTVTPMVAGWIGGADAKKMARLGGLTLVVLDLVQMVLPSGFAYSPFQANASPIVLGGNPAQIAAGAANVASQAAQIANSAAASVSGASSFQAGSNFAPSDLGGEF